MNIKIRKVLNISDLRILRKWFLWKIVKIDQKQLKENLKLKDLAEIKKGLHHIPKTLTKNIGLAEDLDNIKTMQISKKGCVACNFIGYKGRKGIFEVFLIDDQMEKFILTNPPVSSIKELLVKNGMITIYQSGLIEVVLGETTLEEVKKVVGEEE